MTPDDRKYSKEHEWVLVQQGNEALVGITEFAQEQLGDIVYVGLPAVGSKVEQFKKLGEVESVKAVSDIYSPVSGTVLGVNEAASQQPEVVNQDPYGKGWLLKVALADPAELDKLMSAQEYESFLKTQAH